MNALKKSLYTLMTLLVAWSISVAQPARAEVTDNFHSQFSYIVFDACHGENLLVVTDFHGLVKQTVNADGSFTHQFHVNAHGTAVGLTSGTEYIFNDTFRNVETTTSAVFTESFHQRSRFVSPGSAENVVILYDLVFHVEGGHVTIDVLNQSTETRG